MTVYFLDSSAIVKRYLLEIGSNWIKSIVNPASEHRIIVAQITPIEIVSAFARRYREGTLSSRDRRAATLFMERHVRREYTLVRLNDEVEIFAKKLLEVHPLRAYDSVQLASAIYIHQGLIMNSLGGVIFVSSDARLRRVAEAEGLKTDDPLQYP